ncbi:MAG: chondroitinase-B domain-containing protein [Candidatus Nanopelagicales bacterium]
MSSRGTARTVGMGFVAPVLSVLVLAAGALLQAPPATASAPSVAGTAYRLTAVDIADNGGRIQWVGPNGEDYDPRWNPDKVNTRETPWKSIYWAIRQAQPGDTIVVLEGTYVEAAGWGARRGTAARPITLQAEPGAKVTLVGTLQLDRADYWTVTGLTITDNLSRSMPAFLVKFNGGTGWRFVNNEVYGSRSVSNVMVTGTLEPPRNYLIAGNCIHDVKPGSRTKGNDHNLYLMPGVSSGPGVVERNVIFGAPNGANIKAAGNASSASPHEVSIRYNTLAKAAAGITVGLKTTEVSMTRNLIGLRMPLNTAQWGGFDAGVKGYSLSGRGNSVTDSAIYSYPNPVRVNAASSAKIATSGVKKIDPRWNAVGCSALVPTNSAAAAYGHLAR